MEENILACVKCSLLECNGNCKTIQEQLKLLNCDEVDKCLSEYNYSGDEDYMSLLTKQLVMAKQIEHLYKVICSIRVLLNDIVERSNINHENNIIAKDLYESVVNKIDGLFAELFEKINSSNL